MARTLIDLATELSEIALERAVNEADKRDLIDPEALRAALDRYEGEPGAPLLRKLLDKRTFRLSDSDLEILFRPIAAKAGLPLPLSKQLVNGWEVDFHWPDLGLVVETDGLRYHRHALDPDQRRPPRSCPRTRRDDPAPLHPLRDKARTRPGPGRAFPRLKPAASAHPTLTTPEVGQCRMRAARGSGAS